MGAQGEVTYDKDERPASRPYLRLPGNDFHLVIFTVNGTKDGATISAADKGSGSVAWQMPIPGGAISSPVAVYDEAGQAVVQASSDGKLYMPDGLSGQVLNSLDLGGKIEGSPNGLQRPVKIATPRQQQDVRHPHRMMNMGAGRWPAPSLNLNDKSQYLVALDQGTTSSRAIVFTPEKAAPKATAAPLNSPKIIPSPVKSMSRRT